MTISNLSSLQIGQKCSENFCGLINPFSLAAGGRATNPGQVSGEGGRVEGAVQQEFKRLRD